MAGAAINFIRQGFWWIIDIVLPPRCVVTGAVVDRQGMVSPEIWRALNFIAAPLCDCCGQPFEVPMEQGALCGSCIADRPVFAGARAALVYDDASREMVLKFKHADHTHAVYAFLPWLRRAGAEMLERTDLIVPVPLHRWRLLRRRYNQAALIGAALAKGTGLPHLPLMLARTRATPSQGKLGLGDRRKNVKGVFSVNPRFAAVLQGKNVLLVDDVLTTGATVEECAKALMKAGAREVHVLTLARAVRTY